MKFAVVAHRRSATNEALVAAARVVRARRRGARAAARRSRSSSPATWRSPGSTSGRSSTASRAAPASWRGSRPKASTCSILPGALVAAHDKLLTARVLRLAGLPHPHTTLLAPALPAAAPGAAGRAQAALRQLGTGRRALRDGDRGARSCSALGSAHGASRARWLLKTEHRGELPIAPGARSAVDGALGPAASSSPAAASSARRAAIACRGEWRTNAALGAAGRAGGRAAARADARARRRERRRRRSRRRRPSPDAERRLRRARGERRRRLPAALRARPGTSTRTRSRRCSAASGSPLAAASVAA